MLVPWSLISVLDLDHSYSVHKYLYHCYDDVVRNEKAEKDGAYYHCGAFAQQY